MSLNKKIRVLVVDDSAVVRQMLSGILDKDPQITVVGTAEDPYNARDKIVSLKPDVITLDLEMPKMDGLTFLKIIMAQNPIPVIVFSTLTQKGSQYAFEALQLGACDVLAKPDGSTSTKEIGGQIIEKVKAAAVSNRRTAPTKIHRVKAPGGPVHYNPRQLILIGSSTGGTEALKEVLMALPANMPGIVIVQHIPPHFSRTFADRLNSTCALAVKEAEEGDIAAPGRVLIAPGNFHMTVNWTGKDYRVFLNDGPMVWHQRPAVDILFKSAARSVGSNAVAGILTGMGKDGAEGLLELRRAGARTFSQSEKTCVVYGMPKAAYDCGASEAVFDLPDVAINLQKLAHPKTKKTTTTQK